MQSYHLFLRQTNDEYIQCYGKPKTPKENLNAKTSKTQWKNMAKTVQKCAACTQRNLLLKLNGKLMFFIENFLSGADVKFFRQPRSIFSPFLLLPSTYYCFFFFFFFFFVAVAFVFNVGVYLLFLFSFSFVMFVGCLQKRKSKIFSKQFSFHKL